MPTLPRPAALLLGALALTPAWAQKSTPAPTAIQRGVAEQVAQTGVALADLAPNAPDQYTVRRGDTLWGIAGMFLRSPWRWPELWGMNKTDIRNPHLIYPGQQLFLERSGDRARLVLRRGGAAGSGAEPPVETVRVSPRNRAEMLDSSPLPTLAPHLIEPFLAEPLVFDDDTFQRAPRLVAMAGEQRVMMAKGDRAYARGPADAPLLMQPGLPTQFRVFRNAAPLKDPITAEVLGFEGQYVGKVDLVRGESEADAVPAGTIDAGNPLRRIFTAPATPVSLPIPATVDVAFSKEEMRLGDRLLPEPERDFRSYTPHAPDVPVEARVVSIYGGNSARYAGQNAVVAINKGSSDGMENGHVLTLLTGGRAVVDRTDPRKSVMQLPDERNGIAMVFRTFDRVSYALVMQITEPVAVGDKLVNPR